MSRSEETHGEASAVVDDVDGSRFRVEIDGHTGELRYRVRGDRLLLIHTEVAEELEGRGVGGRLVQAGIDRAARDDLTVVPHCRFAQAWLRRHREIASRVSIAWPRDDPRT
jgi:predicted GNAT family acetyltransferase